MKSDSILDALHEKYRDRLEFKYEELVYEFTETVVKQLKHKGWSRKHFAEKMGVTPAYVTKLLYGSNLTIKQMLRVAALIGCDLSLKLIEKDTPRKANVLIWPTKARKIKPRLDLNSIDIELLEPQNVEPVAA